MKTASCLNRESSDKPFDHLLYNYYLKENSAGEYMKDPHAHEAVELEYVIDGQMLLEFGEGVVKLAKDNLVLLRPGVMHRFRIPRNCRGCQRVNLTFDLSILEEQFGETFRQAFEETEKNYILLEKSKAIRDQMRCIVRELSEKQWNYDLAARADFTALIIRVDRNLRKIMSNNARTRNYVQSVKLLVEGDLTEEWSPETLARELNLSPSYLMHVFKSEHGTSIMKYIENERIELAKKLLSETVEPVQTVAEEVGYPNLQYFSYVFKKSVGLPPSQFRKISQEVMYKTVDVLREEREGA